MGCLLGFYDGRFETVQPDSFICPACTNECTCAACRRKITKEKHETSTKKSVAKLVEILEPLPEERILYIVNVIQQIVSFGPVDYTHKITPDFLIDDEAIPPNIELPIPEMLK